MAFLCWSAREAKKPKLPAVAVLPQPDGSLDRVIELQDARLAGEALRAFGIDTPRPVVVVIGGAKEMTDRDLRRLRPALDRAVVPAVVDSGALLLSGGTNAGVMRVLGELVRDRQGIDLLGVAPRKLVRHMSEQEGGEERETLDVGHHSFILTPGETYGSETDVLLALGGAAAGEAMRGVVLLANGGAIARYEARRFLAAGWPVMTLRGTGRSADRLADVVSRSWTRSQVLARFLRARRDWGDLSSAEVEVHDVRRQAVELLARRLRWRLSGQLTLKATWTRFASYDSAAQREQAWSRRFQAGLAGGALLLATLSVAYGVKLGSATEQGQALQYVLLTLPLLLVVTSTLSDSLVPARNWVALRYAAESLREAIYRRQAGLANPGLTTEETLLAALHDVDQGVIRAGVPLAVIPEVGGRPEALTPVSDEFGDLSLSQYLTERIGGQLRYYRATARRLRRRELLAVATSALLAAVATAVATEVFAAPWVPVLILAASAIVVLQQRARWQEKISLSGIAIADLERVRVRAMRLAELEEGARALPLVVRDAEAVLEKERSAWTRAVVRSQDEAQRYSQAHVDGLA